MLCDAKELADEIDIPATFEVTQPRHRVRCKNVSFDYEARADPDLIPLNIEVEVSSALLVDCKKRTISLIDSPGPTARRGSPLPCIFFQQSVS
ncbi:hypothetical protein TNCV_4449961 [Trichonephila clavipes]|nr:hypothetical protein TNCV_4449961 [Trichonephila clavipes]